MTKRKKVCIAVISIVLAVVILISGAGYFIFLHRYRGKNIVCDFKKTDAFDIDKIPAVVKEKDKDFVILNLADVQLCDLEDVWHFKTVKREIEYLVETAKPDLITLTGDQTWSNENLLSLNYLIGVLESFGIPYAPVFGNHDCGNEMDSAVYSRNKCCDVYENARNCLFRRGPTNIGALGNYVVNIMEDGKIFRTVYMLDSGYEDVITDGQKEWFLWNANGIKDIIGYYPESLAFMHKPLPEYGLAYRDYISGGETTAIGSVHVHYSLWGSDQNGFFESAKSVNVKDVVCGHQHGNNFTLLYDGVRLTFALKTGELGGFYEDGTTYLNGATVIRIGGETVIESIFADPSAFRIK